MKKTVVTAVPAMVAILLLVELASAKPIADSENPDFHGVITKPVAGLPDHGIDSTGPNYADFNTPDFIDTVAPDNKKISGDPNSNKSNRLTMRPIFEEIENLVATVKPGSEKPSHLPISSELGIDRLGSLITNLKPDSWTASSPATTLESVSEGKDGFSLVTSLDSGSGEPDNLVTTLEPASLSTTLNGGSDEPGSLLTTLESDSGRRGNLATTSMPGSHDAGNKLTNLPVTGERKNGASDIGSSYIMVLLGIFLIAESQVT